MRILTSISWLLTGALLVGCSSGYATASDEVLQPAELLHEVWGRADQHYSGRGPTVVVLGDDAIKAAQVDLRRSLAAFAIKIAAIDGEGFAGGERSSVDPSVSMDRIARRYAETPPDRVVVALGFNDLRPGGPRHEELMSAAQLLFDRFPDSCIVGVTVLTNPPLANHRSVRGRALNDLIRARSDQIVEWNRMVNRNPGYLRPNGVTPTKEGILALTREIHSSLESCP